MPSKSPPHNHHFLGLELSPEQLRAVVVDEHLDVVMAEQVDFDSEMPEYQTHGGVFTAPGDAYTSPVDMWIKALDLLLTKLRTRIDLAKILAIGGSAHTAAVLWTQNAQSTLQSLHPHQTLHAQLGNNAVLALLHAPSPHDASTAAQSQAIENALGGPDSMAQRVGTPAHPAMPAAQLMKIREGAPEAWSRTGRVTLASTALASILLGKWANVGAAEAAGTGMWNVSNGAWDAAVLEVIAGKDQTKRMLEMLGIVESDGSKPLGAVSKYFVDRFGFDKECMLFPFTSSHLATYLSVVPTSSDALLSFGAADTLLCAAPDPPVASRLHAILPHPAQSFSNSAESRKWIAMLSSRNADIPRSLVRDMYTKSWSAFDRLVAIVPPGGSIGLDDKLFSFWVLQGESYPFTSLSASQSPSTTNHSSNGVENANALGTTSKGIFRFENGIKVSEFRDLRANPRCLLESQLLAFRARFARMTVAAGAKYPLRPPMNGHASHSGLHQSPSSYFYSSNSTTNTALAYNLPFDPYDSIPLPRRIFATGTAAHFPSIVNLLGDIFDAPVFVPSTVLEAAQLAPGVANSGNGVPSRAALGGAYVARWGTGLRRGTSARSGFEEEIRWVLGKRWAEKQSAMAQHNGRFGNASGGGGGSTLMGGGTSPAVGSGSGLLGSGMGSIGKARSSGLAAHALVEEDEDELANAGSNHGGADGQESTFQYPTEDQHNPNPISSQMLSVPPTTLTIPQPSASLSTATPTTAAPLTPIAALQTDDADAQFGLVKVAEPDTDAFLAYAAMVPEFCRLEGLVVRGLA